jgi:hypothetical protein
MLNDFGLARRLEAPPLPDNELLKGTPSCLPPEAVFGHQPVPESDVYQLGLLAALLLCPPFRDEFFDPGPAREPRTLRARRLAVAASRALEGMAPWQACVAQLPGERPRAAELA